MHAGQLLARLSRHEAPIASLPLDFLCALLHQSLRAAVPSGLYAAGRRHCDVIYMRWSRVSGARRGANLVRSETVKLFNASGQVAQVRCPPTFLFSSPTPPPAAAAAARVAQAPLGQSQWVTFTRCNQIRSVLAGATSQWKRAVSPLGNAGIRPRRDRPA